MTVENDGYNSHCSRDFRWFLLLAFYPKIMGGGRDLQMVLCLSTNAG